MLKYYLSRKFKVYKNLANRQATLARHKDIIQLKIFKLMREKNITLFASITEVFYILRHFTNNIL